MASAGINTVGKIEPTEDDIPSWVPDWHALSRSWNRAQPSNWLKCKASKPYRGFLSHAANLDTGVLTWLAAEVKVERIQNCVSFSNPDDRYNFTCAYADKRNPLHSAGLPRLQALLRTVFHNVNPENSAKIDQNSDSFVRLEVDFLAESVYNSSANPTDEERTVNIVAGLFRLGFDGLHFSEEFPEHFRERFLGKDSQSTLPANVSLLESFTRMHMSHYHIGPYTPKLYRADNIFDTSAGYVGSRPPGILVDDTIWFLI